MDVSVILINHNTRALTYQAVLSVIRATHAVSFEIIVVDNSDNVQEQLMSFNDDRVRILPPVENLGFAHGCNIGAKYASGRYLLYLNSDTIVHDGALDKAVAFIKSHPDIGVLGIQTRLSDGTLDNGCKRGFPTPAASLYYFLGLDKKHPESRKYGAYHQTFLSDDETNDVDAVSGSFLLTPRMLMQDLGGFDEAFFMYGEDLDLCYRVKEKGWRVVYFADAVMTHLKGQSGLHQKSKRVIKAFYDAMLLFYNKHYRQKYSRLTTLLVYAGVKLKYTFTLFKSKVKP